MCVTTFCVALQLAILLPAVSASASSLAEQRLSGCLSCHGEDGRSQTPDVPSLGGQPAPYTLIQLFMFRERLRVAAPMNDDAQRIERRRSPKHGEHDRQAAAAGATRRGRRYKTGARHAYDATMAEVLQPVDENDLGVLAYFLAHAQ